MPRKIQRQLIRYLPEKVGQEQSSVKSFSVQEAITVLGGITGLNCGNFMARGKISTWLGTLAL